MGSDEVVRRRPPQALYAKSAANLARPPARRELMTAGWTAKRALMAEVAKLEHAGRVQRLAREAAWNQQKLVWEIPINRIGAPPRRWVRPTLLAGAVLAVLTLVWWALTTLAAAIGAAALFGVLILFVVLVLRHVARPREVDVTTTVTTRVRVR